MNENNLKNYNQDKNQENKFCVPLQNCPLCEEKIFALPGTRDAFCWNCGFKDPCCE